MAKNNLFSITHASDTCKVIKQHLNSKKKIVHVANPEKISRSILAKKIKKYSKKKLSFSVVDHNEINYIEPRSKINLLKSKDEVIKKFNFKKMENLIKKKVQLLEKS
jgi:dTDP-4-dehydrorhamnose reductase